MTLPLELRGVPASQLVLGMMGLGGDWDRSHPITAEHVREAHEAIEAALSVGINMFDHADIYTRGKAELVFGQVLKERPELREKIIIQSKCGIRLTESDEEPGYFDFSKEHILRSVDGSLERLGVEYLDILLLHRPDPLVNPEEVASALRELKAAGKVRHFGVSNMNTGQIRLLEAYCDEPFIVNQLEMSLLKTGFIDTGVTVNQQSAVNNTFPEGLLEHCRLQNIQLQAWGPLAQGLFSGRNVEDQNEKVQSTAKLAMKLAHEKGVSREAVVLAWLMKHPAHIQPVIGTIRPERIRACGEAVHTELSRTEWIQLYITSRGKGLA